MLMITDEQVGDLLEWHTTIDALERAFRQDSVMPTRHHHLLADGASPPVHLLMPAWLAKKYLGVKAVNVFPANAELGKPAVSGAYLLFSGETGEALAALEANVLTARRTAAASALAAKYLAGKNASRLLVVGTGRLSKNMVRAHSAIRPIREIAIWGRNATKAAALAAELRAEGFAARSETDLATAVAQADIVSCVTLSMEPLVEGQWLRPGTHLDLVGGFTPQMREADDEAIRRSSIFVDTRDGASHEAGDIVIPLQSGVLQQDRILGDLFELTRGGHPGRSSGAEITLFKSVGAAIEDLAAAVLVYEKARQKRAAA